jgi:hypothetical protein
LQKGTGRFVVVVGTARYGTSWYKIGGILSSKLRTTTESKKKKKKGKRRKKEKVM